MSRRKLEQINLKELVEEYNNISKYLYCYKLKNGTEIKVRLYNENLPHLLGIQKVANDPTFKKKLQGKKGYDNLKNGQITIESLIKKDMQNKQKVLPQIKDKLLYFNMLETLLNECSIVKFYPERVKGNCKLKSSFILFHEELGVKVHLGVVKDTVTAKVYVAETFIVKKIRDRNKNYYTEGQEFKAIVERFKIPLEQKK